MSKKKVITIDGPAGAGKSTVAKKLADRLGYAYLDTGAMYRAITLKALELDVDFSDEQALKQLALDSELNLKYENSQIFVFIDGNDVSDAIRSQEVTNNIGAISNAEGVREVMVQWQRQYAQTEDLVVEGRDVGTVVFPKAQYKIYLDADVEERTRRRSKELIDRGDDVRETQLKQDIENRDKNDMTRSVGPLKKADDAVVINSTKHTIDEVVDKIIGIIQHG